MINFRFHLISLVAVFLALGVGVAMGASFVDRATVDTLRGRVDDLSEGYRRRGDELDATSDQLAQSDAQAAALAGEASQALADHLRGQPVVLLSTDGVAGEVLDATRTSLGAADATVSGSVRLLPALDLRDEGLLRRVRDRFGLRSGTASDVRTRVVADLGTALAVLAGGTASGAATTTTTSTTTVAGGEGSGTTTTTTVPPVGAPTDTATSQAFLSAVADLGLISIDTGGAPANAAFPDVTGVRYVLAAAPGDRTESVVIPLATSIARQATAVLTVAEARPSRPEGEATTTSEGQPARGETVQPLREGDVAERVSTVDDLDESFGRIAVVYAVAQQHDTGQVGHYGTGSGATAPFPTVPAG